MRSRCRNLGRIVAVLAVLCAARAGASERYSILENTESPDGRYAVAWAQKNPHGGAAADADEEDIQNFIVDQRTKQIVARIKSTYWEENELRANHRSFDVAWSPDSSIVAVLFTLRWGDLGLFEAIHVQDGKALARLDLGKVIDPPLRHYLAKTWSDYAKFRRSIEPLFSQMNPVRKDVWSVDLSAGTPGDKSGESYAGDATMRFKLSASGKELRFALVSVGPHEEPKVSPAEAAEAADQQLNLAYSHLREKLTPAERDELMQEQRAWLKRCDAIADQAQRTEFITARAAELSERTPFAAHPDAAIEDERMPGIWRLYLNGKDDEVDLEFLATGRFRYYNDRINEDGEWTLNGTTLTLECKQWDPPKRVYEKQGTQFANTTDGAQWTLKPKVPAEN